MIIVELSADFSDLSEKDGFSEEFYICRLWEMGALGIVVRDHTIKNLRRFGSKSYEMEVVEKSMYIQFALPQTDDNDWVDEEAKRLIEKANKACNENVKWEHEDTINTEEKEEK